MGHSSRWGEFGKRVRGVRSPITTRFRHFNKPGPESERRMTGEVGDGKGLGVYPFAASGHTRTAFAQISNNLHGTIARSNRLTQSVLFACLITRRYAGTPLAERCSSHGSDRVRFSGVVERDLSRHNVRRCSKDRRSMVLPRSYKQGHPSFCFSRSGDHATQEHDTVARNISSASGVSI